MSWVVSVVLVLFVFLFVIPFFSGLLKDKNELNKVSLKEKFKVIIELLNLAAFDGHGSVRMTSKKTFNLYEDGQNQIISCDYYYGHLTIIWKYKYFHNEIVHQKIFHDLRNISLDTQKNIATEMINEMAVVVENHKNQVLNMPNS
jgi:hypothetical protein